MYWISKSFKKASFLASLKGKKKIMYLCWVIQCVMYSYTSKLSSINLKSLLLFCLNWLKNSRINWKT